MPPTIGAAMLPHVRPRSLYDRYQPDEHRRHGHELRTQPLCGPEAAIGTVLIRVGESGRERNRRSSPLARRLFASLDGGSFSAADGS
jgi:hypothetical protein